MAKNIPRVTTSRQVGDGHYVTLMQARGAVSLFRPVVIHGERKTSPNFNYRGTLKSVIAATMLWAEAKGLSFRPDLAIFYDVEDAPNLLGLTADACREMRRFPASIQWVFAGKGFELAINVWEDAQQVVDDVENLLAEVFARPGLGDEPTADEVAALLEAK